MNSQRLAQRAYQSAATPLRTPRGQEYDAFARVTHRLTAAARDGRQGFAALAEAVHDNRRLWTTLAGAVADPDNILAEELRARIFWLAEFTDSHSRKVLRGEAEAGPLIDINTAVMRGLGSEGSPT